MCMQLHLHCPLQVECKVDVYHVQEYEGQSAQPKHQSAVIQLEQLQLEGYGPFRSACT